MATSGSCAVPWFLCRVYADKGTTGSRQRFRGRGPVLLRRNVRRYAIWFLRGGVAQHVLPGAEAEGRSIPEEEHRPPHPRLST